MRTIVVRSSGADPCLAVGIRKVLGATILNILQLLSREFLLLIAIALLIAIPPAYYVMMDWLSVYQ